MRFSRMAPKKFSTRLVGITLIAGLVPLGLFLLVGQIFVHRFPAEISRAICQGQEEQWRRSETVMTDVMEDFIRQKAMDVALQLDLYLKAHRAMTVQDLQYDPDFREIAVQPVGRTGYTAVFDSDTGVNRFHEDPGVENSSVCLMPDELPELHAIVKASLGGKYAHGSYEGKEPDGTRNSKFIYIAPLSHKTADGVRFNVAAATGIGEFTTPMRAVQDVSRSTAGYMGITLNRLIRSFTQIGLLIAGVGIVLILGFALWVGGYLSRAIVRLREATRAINQGNFDVRVKHVTSSDVAELIDDFNLMAETLSTTTVKKEELARSEERLREANLQLQQKIAEQRETEDALSRSEAYFRALIENSMELVTVIEGDGTIRYESASCKRILGYEPEDLVGKNALEYIHPDDLQMAADALVPDPENPRKERSAELRFRHGSGAWVTLEADGRDLRNHPAVGGIIINSRNITARQQAEDQIRQSLREKENLLAEIHHRVKNNMQIISSLLSLKSSYIADEEALTLVRNCEDRVRAMALVHEKLYLSADLSRIDFSSYVQSMATRLFQTYEVDSRVVTFSPSVKDVLLTIETAIPLGLVINELLSNALRHAFPGGRRGKITVTLLRDEKTKEISLTVADDGVGFPEEIDRTTPKTFGMQLINLLTDQLGGRVELDGNGGTSFRITFREQIYKRRI